MSDINPIPGLGLGVLSWHGYDSLRATLTGYRDAGFLDLFEEKVLFLPDITDTGREIGAEFDLSVFGTSHNLGIMGGFEAMARVMTSPCVMLAENDFILTDPDADHRAMITRMFEQLERNEIQVARFRHLKHPGQKFYIDKTHRYWPLPGAGVHQKILAAVRRICRPDKAHRLKGLSVYYYDDADTRFPNVIKRTSCGDFQIRSDVINWANNVFMIRRDFFLDTIIPAATRAIGGRLINGFPTIETELNRGTWWRDQRFFIGVSNPGLFTHERLDDRGY